MKKNENKILAFTKKWEKTLFLILAVSTLCVSIVLNIAAFNNRLTTVEAQEILNAEMDKTAHPTFATRIELLNALKIEDDKINIINSNVRDITKYLLGKAK